MRVLLFCTRFPLEPGNPYLTNELAHAHAVNGDEVQVVVLDWDAPFGSAPRQQILPDGVKVLSMAPRGVKGMGNFVEKASKWVFSSVLAALDMRKILAGQHFDVLVAFCPVTTVAAQVLWAMRRFRPHSYLVQWDFFPFHQRSIGMMPNNFAFEAARMLEEFLMRRFDTIGCMSPMNVDYLRSHYRLRASQTVEILPIWGETTPPRAVARALIRREHGLPEDRKIIVFGGQITQGRGVDDVLSMAQLAATDRPDLTFLIIGEGRLVNLVEDHAAKLHNVIYRPRIARDQYLQLVSACDVGLVCTVRDVDVPTFPSKLIDYLRANVPVVASIEESTDFGKFIEERGVGISVLAGDPAVLLQAICNALENSGSPDEAQARRRLCLEEVFDVEHTVRSIQSAVNRGKAV